MRFLVEIDDESMTGVQRAFEFFGEAFENPRGVVELILKRCFQGIQVTQLDNHGRAINEPSD